MGSWSSSIRGPDPGSGPGFKLPMRFTVVASGAAEPASERASEVVWKDWEQQTVGCQSQSQMAVAVKHGWGDSACPHLIIGPGERHRRGYVTFSRGVQSLRRGCAGRYRGQVLTLRGARVDGTRPPGSSIAYVSTEHNVAEAA
eukprot:403770-Rhodomonas_salina.2